MPQTIFIIIIAILVFGFLLERFLEYLNGQSISTKIPEEAKGIYDEEKYKKMMEYQKVNYRFDFLSDSFSFILMLAMLVFGGFAFLDDFVRAYTEHPILMALLFFGIIGIASDIISEPFSLYGIFVIEEKFGFNKTTFKTYLLDKLKALLLSVIIGVPLLSLVIWFYQIAGNNFWIYAWLLMSAFMIFMAMFYTSLIVPLFNKLTPLADGELKHSIIEYCKKVGFGIFEKTPLPNGMGMGDGLNIFVIDGSKRSTKANAYFSGLGAKKKIVLYDTLIDKHTAGELVAILAHEVGHYKKKHTRLSIVLSVLQSGIMLFIFSLALENPDLSFALGAEEPSFHIGAIVFGMLYSPLSMLLGIAMNMLSRKNEFEADAFAKETSDAKALQSALKKLSADNLSNLTPHPLYVFFNYSHPPLLERLKKLE